jgi:hypothetical protein
MYREEPESEISILDKYVSLSKIPYVFRGKMMTSVLDIV